MTRNAETPDTPAAGSWPASTGPAKGSQSGPVAELGLVAAGLGLVIYLISFVTDLGGSTSPALPLLLGGGLLAGTVALPTVDGRVLAPAAVVTTTGALLLLRSVVDGGGALVAGALVLGLLEAGATVGATLMQAGVLRSRPPKARKASAASPFAGYPGGPQFPGQQYPGQPFPGTYPAAPATEPHPGDQWTGEHAYGQNAQYGSQYGVPGYPPPPPYGAPGFDPSGYDPAGPAVDAVGAESPGNDTASPPRGTRPVTEPVAEDLGSGYSAVEQSAGSHRAVPDPGAVSGTGTFRLGSRSATPEGTGAHRAASGTGSYPAAESTHVSGTGAYRRGAGDLRSDDDEHTRALPTVPEEQR